MHILIVALHRPSEPTGVCRHATNLARCLAQTDAVSQITLVTGAWQQHYFKNIFLADSQKIRVQAIEIENTLIARNYWYLFDLPKLAVALRPDLVHLSFPLPFIRPLFACPVVATIHDLYPYTIPENFGYQQFLFNRLTLKICIAQSDAFACVSQTTLDDLKYYFPQLVNKKTTTVIYNLVDFAAIEPSVPQALADGLDRPFILCVGQHRKNKNFDLAIAAFANLIHHEKIASQTRTIVVGSPGPETENLVRSIAKFGLENSVVILSSINDSELCWLYQNCEILVIPAAVEGFCLPLVEALYFTTKVVCSDIPIFREIGSPSCFYFDLKGERVINLATAISDALMVDKVPENYDLSRFTYQTIAERYLKFYFEAIERQKIKNPRN